MMKTRVIKQKEVNQNWYLFDAKNVRLGKLAVEVSKTLMGKDKVNSADNLDDGDYVVVINVKELSFHPKKLNNKKYYSHSGYMGSLKTETLKDLFERKPDEVLRKAVKGMLPKNKIQAKILNRLYIYETSEHKHEAQKPIQIKIK